jgi:DNA adenine methylase
MTKAALEHPIMRYYGGKWRMASWIVSHFPEHDIYVEPFAGAASVFFHKPEAQLEVLNDLDGEVVNLFKVLQAPETRDRFLEYVYYTPYSRQTLYETYGEASLSKDPVVRAANYFIRVTMSYAHTFHRRSGFSTRQELNVVRCSDLVNWATNLPNLYAASNRLRRTLIENYPAEKIVRIYDDPLCLIYCDPPYHGVEDSRSHYSSNLSEKGHIELAVALHESQSMAIISNYLSDLYIEMYKDWRLFTRNNLNMSSKSAVEGLWLSPSAYEALAREKK